MIRRLVASYIGLTLVVLVALGVPLDRTIAGQEKNRLEASARSDAAVLASRLSEPLESAGDTVDNARDWPDVVATIDSYASEIGGRVIVTDTSGRTLADTEPGVALDRDYSTRPEVQTALEGRISSAYRRSDSLGETILVAAAPIASGGEVFGVLRITIRASSVDAVVASARRRLAVAGGAVLVAAAVIGFVMARTIATPLREMARRARHVGDGHLDMRDAPTGSTAEIVELNNALNEAARRIDTALSSQRAFVADASHQLRTPLTAIQLRLDNLAESHADVATSDPGGITEHTAVEAIMVEVTRMRGLVDQLLMLARAEEPAAMVEVDVDGTLTERADIWSATMSEIGGSIAVRGHTDAPIRAPEGTLEQILDNLIDNATRATTCPAVELSTSARRRGVICIDVVDRGPGLDDTTKLLARQRFWSGHVSRTGSGLGLPIVDSLMRVCGGSMELLDTPGGGLTVRLAFPAVDATSHRSVGDGVSPNRDSAPAAPPTTR